MSLITTSELPLKSPITGETSLEVPGAVQLRDMTPNLGVLHLRGPQAQTAIIRFSGNQPGHNALATGEARRIDAGILCRLATDEYLLLLESPEEWGATFTRLEVAAGGYRAMVSDLTHGFGKLEFSGSRAAELLPRLCCLDFSEVGFPNGHTAQTSLAKVHATLVRMDNQAGPPKYFLLIERSLSAYVWEVMRAVMQAINPKPGNFPVENGRDRNKEWKIW